MLKKKLSHSSSKLRGSESTDEKARHYEHSRVGLGNIPVLRYYHDKYVIITSVLTYRANCANYNTTTTINATSTKPLPAEKYSRYKLETSCLQCSIYHYVLYPVYEQSADSMAWWAWNKITNHATVLCIGLVLILIMMRWVIATVLYLWLSW